MLKLSNTLTDLKQEFIPLHAKKVGMYICGITPYDDTHIGHGRCYTIFDVLYRALKFLEFDVTYVRNFTDIDDKLLKRAQEEFNDQFRYRDIADRYIARFHEDIHRLHCLEPTVEPRVTDHIPEIISFIEELIKSGHAYVAGGDVYYHVRSFPEYGKLSKRNIDDLLVGARVDVRDFKKDPLDFALWKAETHGTFWKSPWGYGRPGWHIECSVLANHYLGHHFDIHGGGMDLIFPHHENEIAQTEGLFDPRMAQYWVHNAFVRINKEKMSKSLGNFFTLRQIFEKFHPFVVRYYLLSTHYRAPLDFSFDDLAAIETTYQRLARVFAAVNNCPVIIPEGELMDSPVVAKMLAVLLDDLNTPGMFGVLHEHLDELKKDPKQLCLVKKFMERVIGLPLDPLPEKMVEITPEIQALIDERAAARAIKDFKRADELRDQLTVLGVEVQDKKITKK